MRHSHIRTSNLQWLCEDFPVTCRIAAAEVAGIDQESHPIAEKLQILQLTRTVTVDAAAPVATPGARGCAPPGACRDYQTGICLRHSFEFNLPVLAFCTNQTTYLA